MSAQANGQSGGDGAFGEKQTQDIAAGANGQSKDAEKQAESKAEQDGQKHADGGDGGDGGQKHDGPEGGYDATPIPSRPAGFTIKVKFHKATNLPMADINSLSSDPYVLAQINTDVPTRHKEDPPLRFRTSTVRQDTDPEWNEDWIIANVPASGFKLKLRLYDEDPNDKDDRLGNVHITVPSLSEGWAGIPEQAYEVKARAGSKRAYAIRIVAVCFSKSKHIRGHLYVSIEMLGRTKPDGQNGRLYTAGPCRWVRHYDPILGRLANIKEPDNDDDGDDKQQQQQTNGQPQDKKDKKQKKVEKYNFQANQIQLQGPIPAELYHRYVEFKPWVKRMFTASGLTGGLIGKALHHQHSRVYHFDRQTVWGHFPQGPSLDMTAKFLDLVHWDKGGRIFTYVLTLDALWRFTETGQEFGIDMLSKHTMHSDVSIYIAFSGEFFIRRLKHGHRPEPPAPVEETSQDHPPEHEENEMHPPKDIGGGPPDTDPPRDPSHYQLVIDNDSGTYRPNAAMLPLLRKFLARSLPGLHIQTLDCKADADKMARMKGEQRDRKKAEGDDIVYTQGSRGSSVSSSDEDDLDRIERGRGGGGVGHGDGGNVFSQAARDQKLKGKGKLEKAKRTYGGRSRSAAGGGEDGDAVAGGQEEAS
ncbi:hypothetical protein LTR36_007131 [Oleoguttula mirabilis]|uniref:C2 domain-containing protein n=1 Tax=Oleoguttula mirabilis TaxID=1507867 RepID=A0AAV9JB19_9PEZI|nr:hypothetical protein LTR36_007131 [Oleoguttula mirabilis]